MKIELYEALTGLNIGAEQTKEVIQSLQEHIDMQVSRANEAVIAKLDGLGTRMEALVQGSIAPMQHRLDQLDSEKQLRVQRTRWVVGTMIGTVGAGLALLHALHFI